MGPATKRHHRETGCTGGLLEVRPPQYEESRRRAQGFFDPFGTLDDKSDYATGLGESEDRIFDLSTAITVDEGELVIEECPKCHKTEVLTKNEYETICSGCQHTFATEAQEQQQLFDVARRLNPKPFRSSGQPVDQQPQKPICATPDCLLPAIPESIFCVACDHEQWHPVGSRRTPPRVSSGSVTEDVARRRKAIQDHKRGIGKAVL